MKQEKQIKVRLKLKSLSPSEDRIKTLENVIEIFIEQGFLFIVRRTGKDESKIDPVELGAIDYWEEIGKLDDGVKK